MNCSKLIILVILFFLSGCQTTKNARIINDKFTPYPPSKSKYIKGINQQQWQVISKIGDPLNCKNRIETLNKIKEGNKIYSKDFRNNSEILQDSIYQYDVTFLNEGTYNLEDVIYLPKDKYLIGLGDVILNAENVDVGIMHSGFLKNITIDKAKKYGIDLVENSTTYMVVISRTGIDSEFNHHGNGVNSSNNNSSSNCLVSVESAFGYNEKESTGKVTGKGGNADGFTVKYSAYDITFIDTHAHHNSDDGYDFWKGGILKKSYPNEPTIRIFYSSANLNGKNPFAPNGDGNGFKFGSGDNNQIHMGKDAGKRLVYGSVACNNLVRGFDRNETPREIIANNLDASGNKINFYKIKNKNIFNDQFMLNCGMFPK